MSASGNGRQSMTPRFRQRKMVVLQERVPQEGIDHLPRIVLLEEEQEFHHLQGALPRKALPEKKNRLWRITRD